MLFRSRIANLLLINYALPPERLQPHVPDSLPLRCFPAPGGEGEVAFLSVVWLRQRGLRAAALPWPRWTFEELNIRAYVDCGGEPGVFFLAVEADTPLTTWSRPLRLGWRRAEIEISDSGDQYSAVAASAEGRSSCLARLGAPLTEGTSHFPDAEAMQRFFTHPLRAAVRAGRSLRRIEVEHPPFAPRLAELGDAYCAPLERWDLLSREEQLQPHSALYQPASEFQIRLPASQWR